MRRLPWEEFYKHRQFRHHREGIEEAREIFGEEGALAAEIHILSDNNRAIPERREYAINEYRLSNKAAAMLAADYPSLFAAYCNMHKH